MTSPATISDSKEVLLPFSSNLEGIALGPVNVTPSNSALNLATRSNLESYIPFIGPHEVGPVIKRNWCSPKFQTCTTHFLAACFSASIIGLAILINKNEFSISERTMLAMAMGVAFQGLLKCEIKSEHHIKINSFISRWACVFHELWVYISFNSGLSQRMFPLDGNKLEKFIEWFVGFLVGNVTLTDLIAFLRESRMYLDGVSDPKPTALKYLNDRSLPIPPKPTYNRDCSTQNKQIVKIILGIISIIVGEVVLKPLDPYNITTDVGAGLAGHAIGRLFAEMVQTRRNTERETILGTDIQSHNSLYRTFRKTRCLRLSEFFVDLAIKCKYLVCGVGLPISLIFNIPKSTMIWSIALFSSVSEVDAEEQFNNHEYPYVPPKAPEKAAEGVLITSSSCGQKTIRKISRVCSDTHIFENILKAVLLAGLFSWLTYGITIAEQDANKTSLAFLMTSLVGGYLFTKLVDNRFKPEVTNPTLRKAYFYFVQFSDYLTMPITYAEYLLTMMSKNAFANAYNSTLTNLSWSYFGVAAGNSQACEEGSLGRQDISRPVLRILLTTAAVYMLFNRIQN